MVEFNLPNGRQPWPLQVKGCNDVVDTIESGCKRMCLTSPTGTGKASMILTLIEWALANGMRVALFTHRKMLLDQLSDSLESHRVKYAVVASGHEDRADASVMVQLCMIHTISARVLKRRKGLSQSAARSQYPLPQADLVLIDEMHVQAGDTATAIFTEYVELGGVTVGVTATPLGVSHLADKLLIAGNNSEGRDCGALVLADMYSCPEIDMRSIEKVNVGEFSMNDVRSVWCQAIYASVFETYQVLNPENKPFLLFAPGVEESIQFAQDFTKRGVPTAHIDGEDVWVDGEFHNSNADIRADVMRRLKSGEIKGICNRFVLREGVDIPYLEHLILATPIGSLLSYVQVVGRILRAYPGIDRVCIQDHGGNWWRHGGPNADRDDIWREFFNDDESMPTKVRAERIRDGKEDVAVECRACHALMGRMPSSRKCYKCGASLVSHHSRKVIERSGKLVDVTGLPFKKFRKVAGTEMEKAFASGYFSAKKHHPERTFAAIRGFICSGRKDGYENLGGCYPDASVPLTPLNPIDWFKPVSEVPMSRLVPRREEAQKKQKPSLFSAGGLR